MMYQEMVMMLNVMGEEELKELLADLQNDTRALLLSAIAAFYGAVENEARIHD